MNSQQQNKANIDQSANKLPFILLVSFTLLIYLTPQAYIPMLYPLHLPRLCAVVAILLYVFNSLRYRQSIFLLDFETRLLLLIALIAIAFIPFSIWPGGSLAVLKRNYFKVILIFLLMSNVLISISRIKTLLRFIIFCCIILALIAVKDFFAGNFSGGQRIAGAGSGIAANPNDLALTLVLVIPFALSFLQTHGSKLTKIFAAAYALLGTFAIICTFSRGGLIILTAVYALFFLKLQKETRLKLFFPAVALIIIFILILPSGYTDRMSSIFDFSKDLTGSATAREATSKFGIQIMLEHPITGVGIGMNTLALNELGRYWEKIHNVYLEFGAELGVPAMIIFIILLIRLIKTMRLVQLENADKSHSNDISFLAQATEISLVAFTIAGFFYPVAYNFYFYYIAAFAVALKRISQSSEINKTLHTPTALNALVLVL